ncbi:hypothetical protein CEXT_296311 [Caerostris extrusa]|uniref:Globin family profile domain-containing protein n=1 Tax=Caerostris extrusa TaxID=172846 RepID=A0AAV4TGK8_CAEEX|nr:hypothetical protein CEXT_296311 [Caerostris extrusa]
MGFVQKVVARFEEPDKSEALLQELGKNHVMYGAKMDYVDGHPLPSIEHGILNTYYLLTQTVSRNRD